MKDFNDKIVYITGGSAGIGLATAKALAAKGAHVVIFARTIKNLKTAAAQIASARQSEKQKIAWESLDVANHTTVKQIMSKVVKKYGVPDVLINCAGKAIPRYFQDISYKQFDDIMKTNLYGYWNTISTLFPFMKEKGGYIVNVASMSGFLGVFGYTDYTASKYAVIGFSEALKSELKGYGIDISVLCPSDTDTPGYAVENRTKPLETRTITETASVMTPEKVTEALLKGMRSKKFIIIPGLGGKMIYIIKRLFPWIVEMVMNLQIKGVQKKKLKK